MVNRENNKKRSYLALNPKQSKHTPSLPKETLDMFEKLFNHTKMSCQKILVIGFAETATAIGLYIAKRFNATYMQTTRETFENIEYIEFCEEHSHSTEQKIIKSDLLAIIDEIDSILFVEDELTTGKTILNAISAIKKQVGDKKFYVSSIVSFMSPQHEKRFLENNITHFYCHKMQINPVDDIKQKQDEQFGELIDYTTQVFYANKDIRKINKAMDIEKSCEQMSEFIEHDNENEEILVLGTEEFMYPAIYFANKLEKNNKVYCHATTRSPIIPSSQYIVKTRHKLCSVYQEERTVFLYNLKKYNCVYIITDGKIENNKGINEIVRALTYFKNDKIKVVEWVR